MMYFSAKYETLSRFNFSYRFLSRPFLKLGVGVVESRMEAVLGNLAVLLFFYFFCSGWQPINCADKSGAKSQGLSR